MTTLHTSRLTLRPVRPADLPAMTALVVDQGIGRYHGDDPTRPDAVAALLGDRGPRETGYWVFVEGGVEGGEGTGGDDAGGGRVVGFGHVRVSAELPGGVLEAGLCLAREHRGSGLGGEAARAILAHAHHTLGAPVVFTLVPDRDARAARFARGLGFLDVGRGEHYGALHRVLVSLPPPGGVHHVELWVADLPGTEKSLGWLLTELGWREYQRWSRGVSWRHGASYVVVEDSVDRRGDVHDRVRPGLNHLAFHVRTRAELDRVTAAAPEHGWRLLFADRHPHAGGPGHYAAYLDNEAGFEVELVAADHVV